jgi:phosphatidylserine/phosphatidylglycerophosphate/cardiolipin synthase-like enzyme
MRFVLLSCISILGCTPAPTRHICPRECTPEIVADIIDSADESVFFMVFSFTDQTIADALIRAKDRGITVAGVMEKGQNSKYSQYKNLQDAGVDVRWDKNRAYMHHKVFIIDRKTVITGSANPSGNGYTKNNDNILIIRSPAVAEEYYEEFTLLI